MRIINLDRIVQELFSDERVRNKIVADLQLQEPVTTVNEFRDRVEKALNPHVDDPLDNKKVFRAAVFALGSNCRSWHTFLNNQNSIKSLLCDFDPVECSGRLQQIARDLPQYLPGFTRLHDVEGICRWAALLAERPDYYAQIKRLGSAFHALAQQRGHNLPMHEVMLCLAAYLQMPPERKWSGSEPEARKWNSLPKLPGMGCVLASEFFRNMGWNGFKPDRHVKRLFDQWGLRENVDAGKESLLVDLVGSKHQDVREFISYSLVGIAASPSTVRYSIVDNWVWMLGRYVWTKKKSHCCSRVLYTTAKP